jgi:ankyrin repeat protein
LIQEQGRLALHAIFTAAEYSFAKDEPPENALQIRLPLGKLTVQHFRTLLSTLGTELIRNRDESGKLPIHIACRNKAPVKVLALILEHDTATLQMVDANGALPIHDCCCGAVDDSSVRFLVRQGGVSTLAARNQDGAMPLHVLCGSTNPSLRSVQFLIQSYPKALAARTKAGQYPLLIAASSTASLSVVYGLVRTYPDLDALH